jgi:hypothetical protein
MHGDTAPYNAAIEQVMSDRDRHDVHAASDALEAIAKAPGVADAIETIDGIGERSAHPQDLGALATDQACPQVDAAYRLGVAMGLVFSRMTKSAPAFRLLKFEPADRTDTDR